MIVFSPGGQFLQLILVLLLLLFPPLLLELVALDQVRVQEGVKGRERVEGLVRLDRGGERRRGSRKRRGRTYWDKGGRRRKRRGEGKTSSVVFWPSGVGLLFNHLFYLIHRLIPSVLSIRGGGEGNVVVGSWEVGGMIFRF